MRTSTILLAVAAILLTAAAAVIGFVAGRAGVVDDRAPATSEPTKAPIADFPGHTDFPRYELRAEGQAAPSNPRADLILALERPAPERARAVRLAMNAWLAAEGAAAIMAGRDDPELADVADRMMQLALYVYPELVVDNPELLEGLPAQSFAMAVSGIATFNSDAARAMVDTHLSNSMYGDAMLSWVDELERPDFSAQDPRAELESILEERVMMKRIPRLDRLVNRVASDDPAAAAELIDDVPGSLKRHAIRPLVEIWSRTGPEEAARWLETQDSQASQEGLDTLAWQWGHRDLEAASTFAATLTGRRRAAFLGGLVRAVTQRLSNNEMLAWVSRYENDPAYPNLVEDVASQLVREDAVAAIELVETLPEEGRLSSYQSVVSSLASQSPEAALDLVDEIGDSAAREEVLPMISVSWGRNDPEAALDWAINLERGIGRDRALDFISFSLMEFDIDLAVDALDEVDDPEIRGMRVRQLLRRVETDDEAIRIGSRYDIDRDAVLELR